MLVEENMAECYVKIDELTSVTKDLVPENPLLRTEGIITKTPIYLLYFRPASAIISLQNTFYNTQITKSAKLEKIYLDLYDRHIFIIIDT